MNESDDCTVRNIGVTMRFCLPTHRPVKNNVVREQREEKTEMALRTHMLVRVSKRR